MALDMMQALGLMVATHSVVPLGLLHVLPANVVCETLLKCQEGD